jgi:hypothetical protein
MLRLESGTECLRHIPRSLLQNEPTILTFNECEFAGHATQNRSHAVTDYLGQYRIEFDFAPVKLYVLGNGPTLFTCPFGAEQFCNGAWLCAGGMAFTKRESNHPRLGWASALVILLLFLGFGSSSRNLSRLAGTINARIVASSCGTSGWDMSG